jgi:hypothetical protein
MSMAIAETDRPTAFERSSPPHIDWERLARANTHPLRVAILEILGMDGGRTLSPSDMCLELQMPLANTNYHVTELLRSGLIELAGKRKVRGATEHFYRLAEGQQAEPRLPRSWKRLEAASSSS